MKIWFFKKKKNEFRHPVGTHRAKCRVHKMATLLGRFWGSNLNLSWSKCSVWLVDQWVPHLSLCFCLLDCWLHIESSWYHYPLCMFGYCIRLRHGHTNYIDWSSCLSSHIDSPYCMITLFTLTCIFSMLLIFFIFISWLFLLYTILIILEHVILAIYPSQLSYFLLSLCVDLDDIYMCFAWLFVA